MIYVLEFHYLKDSSDDNSGIERVIKVGYSSNFEHRFKQYCVCGDKNIRVLFKIDGGTMKDEQNLHLFLRNNFTQIRELGKEWYKKTDSLIKFFEDNDSLDKILQVITPNSSEQIFLKVPALFYYAVEDIIGIDGCIRLNIKKLKSLSDINQIILNIDEIKNRILYYYDLNTYIKIDRLYKDKIKLYEINKKEIDEFKEKFENLETTYGKMKLLCTTELSEPAKNQILDCIPEYFKKFYIALGPDRCKACGYDYTRMKRELDIKIYNSSEVEVAVKQEFHVGDRISYKDAKKKAKRII